MLPLHNLHFLAPGQVRLKTDPSYLALPLPKLAVPTVSKSPSENPFTKLSIMAPSSNAVPKVHSPSGYLELLPATTYVVPKPVATLSQSHLTDHDFDMPAENETKAATMKKRLGSISTVSRVGSSEGGDGSRFLELVPMPALDQ